MHRGKATLTVAFDLVESPARGYFSAPDLGAIGIPLTDVELDRDVTWKLVGDATATTFEGMVNGKGIAGTFQESGGSAGTFQLHRVATSIQPPYAAESVTFANGPVTLSGTLLSPRDGTRHPAILFVQGSGAESRYASAYLADFAARHGFVALIYDKRGVGLSTGDWRNVGFDELASDASAGIDLLAGRADVDPARIGVYGHSQGATLAPAIAARDARVRWIVAADGAIGPIYEQDLYRVRNAMETQFTGQDLADAMALFTEFVDLARNGGSHKRFDADEKRWENAPWLPYLALPIDKSWIWSWYRRIGNYDNTPAWEKVRVPVLIVFGGRDTLVPPQASIDATVAILRAHDPYHPTVHLYPDADHTLHVPPVDADDWPHNPPGYPDAIVEWIEGLPAAQATP
jgi:uncharacterized protein